MCTDMRKELMRYKEQACDLRGASTVADNRRVSLVADSILIHATTIIDRSGHQPTVWVG